MQTLKLSVSLPDDTHPEMELRLSADDSTCDVVIALPMQQRSAGSPSASKAPEAPRTEHDDYVLGGYAGI